MLIRNATPATNGDTYIPMSERDGDQSVIYFTRDISPEGLRKAVAKVSGALEGKVAIKLHTGEQHGPNIIPSAWVKELIENDLPAVESVSYETIQKTKRLLMLICSQVPFEPNMTALWKQLETNNDLGLKMLYALDKAQILSLLTTNSKNYKHLYKPDKIFLSNTNLMHALCPTVDKGNERETFFLCMTSAVAEVKTPQMGDFIVDGKFLFEVGGRRKSFAQIKDIPESFLAVDDTEIGFGNRIPLWMFGLIY
jgi:hypothetical protein